MKRGTITLLVWLALLGIVFLAMMNRGDDESPKISMSAEEAIDLINSDHVIGHRFENGDLVLVTGDAGEIAVPNKIGPVMTELTKKQIPQLQSRGRRVESSGKSDLTRMLVFAVIALAVLAGIVIFLRRVRGGSMQNIFEMRKSKARVVDNADKAHFTDIGGNQQAVELMADIVDFLRAPERWTSAGLRIPRGILVVGPPGTGKTLLARAVAGETKSTFLYTSATEFVEMFVGIGAARVRDTFEKALAQQPAVVFIDELDAIGRRRGSGTGAMHEEREQTLNQLLVSLDGIEQHKRIVVIAATNRPDVLDAALLRAGRFDRMLRLGLPTNVERLEILKIHTRAKPLDAALDLTKLAEQTEGFSGADLEALTNAAGLLAVRRSRAASNGAPAATSITQQDFDRSRDEMIKSNRQFNRLESVLVDSVSQFSEPVGPAAARITLSHGAVLEGDVLWMNASHMKLRLNDGTEVIVVKENASQIESLDKTNTVAKGDFTPDPWAGRTIDAN